MASAGRKAGAPAETWRRSISPRLAHPHRSRHASAAPLCTSSPAKRICARIDPGGIDVLTADLGGFRAALTAENHTLKRALTDPRFFSGIGNAYSDEILHAARPLAAGPDAKADARRMERLFAATQRHLACGSTDCAPKRKRRFPEKVTAFREGMAVHGRYGEPCPRCGEKVLRIRYADNETNYCARCQTGGKVLADRGLSRLLGRTGRALSKNWSRSGNVE